MHCWSIFNARTNHEQIQTHKIHHGLDLGEAITFPLIVYSMPLHEAHIQMAFCSGTPTTLGSQMGVSKLSKLRLPQLWGPITLCANLQLRWGLKQSYCPCWELSNNMLHVTCTRRNWVNFWLLVVGSQIGNLIPIPSFGHNLCFRCPNGSCKPTLKIYVPRAFQWYKKLPNLMIFGPCNCSMKIWESTRTPIPKMGAHLGVWEFILSHSPTFSTSQEHEMWLRASLLVRTFVSLCLGREPKARVTTIEFSLQFHIYIYISYVLIFFGFCGKRLSLIVNDICNGTLELKNLLGCAEGWFAAMWTPKTSTRSQSAHFFLMPQLVVWPLCYTFSRCFELCFV